MIESALYLLFIIGIIFWMYTTYHKYTSPILFSGTWKYKILNFFSNPYVWAFFNAGLAIILLILFVINSCALVRIILWIIITITWLGIGEIDRYHSEKK